MGMLTAWSAAHLVQTAAGAGEADDDGDNKEHKDGQADGHSRPEPAKEPGVTKAPHTQDQQATAHPPRGAPVLLKEVGEQIQQLPVCSLSLLQSHFLMHKMGCETR